MGETAALLLTMQQILKVPSSPQSLSLRNLEENERKP